MSTIALLAILTICEFTLVTLGFAIYLILKKYRHNKKINLKSAADVDVKLLKRVNFVNLLQEQLTKTENRINICSPEDSELLKSRAKFIKSEILAADIAGDDQIYWSGICERMTEILPATSISNNDDSNTDLTELGDIDDDISGKINEPPVLENSIATDNPMESQNLSQDSDLTEIDRLRKIIGRQHNSINDLKRVLKEQNLDSKITAELENKLEEIEVAHAQLSMCVATLESENEKLKSLAQTNDGSTITIENSEDYPETKEQLEKARERISELVLENSELTENIQNLEAEIFSLKNQLKTRTLELEKLQSMKSDLSIVDKNNGSHTPELLTREIEDITELLVLKSEQLSKLQEQEELQSSEGKSPPVATQSTIDDSPPLLDEDAENNDERADIEISNAMAEIDTLSMESSSDYQFSELNTPSNDESSPPDLDTAIDEMLDLTAGSRTK